MNTTFKQFKNQIDKHSSINVKQLPKSTIAQRPRKVIFSAKIKQVQTKNFISVSKSTLKVKVLKLFRLARTPSQKIKGCQNFVCFKQKIIIAEFYSISKVMVVKFFQGLTQKNKAWLNFVSIITFFNMLDGYNFLLTFYLDELHFFIYSN